jgi:hypothetical protein
MIRTRSTPALLRGALALAGALLAVLGVTAPLAAQSEGTVDLLVSDALTMLPLRGATVQLDGVPRATSDSAGQVWLVGVGTGRHRLAISAQGREGATPEIEVRPGEVLRLEVLLERPAVMLATLPVLATPQVPETGPFSRPRPHGGRFFSREQLARMGVTHLGELLMRLGRLSGGGGIFPPGCSPRIVADGVELLGGGVGTFPVQDLEAVELYSIATMPPEYGSNNRTGCGLIVVYTRHG